MFPGIYDPRGIVSVRLELRIVLGLGPMGPFDKPHTLRDAAKKSVK